MKRNTAVIDQIPSALLVRPHVVGQLIDVLVGDWQPDSAQEEQFITHLSRCSDCRTALIVLPEAEPDDAERSAIHDVLRRFVAIHYEIERQEHERIGAYAELRVAKGEKKADESFPLLVEHIKSCARCKLLLDETMNFLQGYEKTD